MPASALPDQALASLVVAHAAAAMYVMDNSGRVTWMNPAAVTMFGWTEAECVGRVLHELLHHRRPNGEPFPMSECPLGAVMTSGTPLLHHEDAFIHQAGHFVPVSCSNAPVLRDGVLVGAALVVHDLTERRRAEEEAARARQQLKISERNLEQAYATAVAANRRKDEFLAMLSHELRNPLAPIVTALALLRLRGTGFERELAMIDRQVQHLTTLVGDLLDVSRITRGLVRLQKRRLAVAEFVSSALELASPLLEQRRHAVDVQLPEEPLYVDGDVDRLSQVLANLLSNAAKYTPPEGRITLRGLREHGNVVLEVEDNGVGITPDLLPHVFDSFVQGERTADGAHGGLGIGLMIVKSLVELHDGRVTAFSAGREQGSVFRVQLPLSTLAHQGSTASLDAPTADSSDDLLAGVRVLIVDDNEDAAELLSLLFEDLRMEAKVAHDGPSALALVADFTPDIAILDIGLPVMDGYELARQLRLLPALDGVRLVALTGYGSERDRERTASAKFDAHLTKPVEIDVLLTTLRELVTSRRRGLAQRT